MKTPNAAILTGFGINSEQETAHALAQAGARTQLIHFNTLAHQPELLEGFQIFALPGGWSFADDIQSGRVLANKFRHATQGQFKKFVDEGKSVIGICNGFQALVQLGALPGWDDWKTREVTLMRNRNGRFEDRWVRLRTESSECPYAQGMPALFTLPIRHGEGQFAMKSQRTLERLVDNKQVVFRYASSDGLKANAYPDNPNGSGDAIAGICNEEGNVLGLMPHPECHVRRWQNPYWTASPPAPKKPGLMDGLLGTLGMKKRPTDYGNCMPIFEGMVEYARKLV